MKKAIMSLLLLVAGLFSFSQVTTSSITGVIKGSDGKVLEGASIHAIHVPTGTQYT